MIDSYHDAQGQAGRDAQFASIARCIWFAGRSLEFRQKMTATACFGEYKPVHKVEHVYMMNYMHQVLFCW